jgi:biopolymer transport protein ExbD
MAYKPSARRTEEGLSMDLDIRPVMNLMVVLIPLLLQGAEWVKLGAIEINAPPSKSGGNGAADEQDKKEEEKVIGLKLAVTTDGITIANAVTVLTSDQGEGPTVPINVDSEYDYELLRTKLIEIKEKIVGQGYKDENRVVITASKEIEYKNIVELIDNVQTYEDAEGNQKPLFPEVNFGSVL